MMRWLHTTLASAKTTVRIHRGKKSAIAEDEAKETRQTQQEGLFMRLSVTKTMLKGLSPRKKPSERLLESAPDDFGLLITFHGSDDPPCDEQDDGQCFCTLKLVPDQALPHIHPNAYGPLDLKNVRRLGGGGSGVSVFSGEHPSLGDVVMKHGGHKDISELFALVTIAHTLQLYSARDEKTAEAVREFRTRIPSFRMIYISPQHFTERPNELLMKLQAAKRRVMNTLWGPSWDESMHSSVATSETEATSISSESEAPTSRREEKEEIKGRAIRIYRHTDEDTVCISRHPHHMEIVLEKSAGLSCTQNTENLFTDCDDPFFSIQLGGTQEDGYESFKTLVGALEMLQRERRYKFTLAQKTIGWAHPLTASSYLTRGELHGSILEKLIDEYIRVIHDLQQLTDPTKDQDVGQRVRKELKSYEHNPYALACNVSNVVDAYCGFAIVKNYHPWCGRFFQLRRAGDEFRHHKLFLSRSEKLPAHLLGLWLDKEGSCMSDVVEGAGDRPTALQATGYKIGTWTTMLRHAVDLKSPAAHQLLWNGGVTDGGLHNLFLSLDVGLYLFDLGEPKYMTLPGFLTKFLFSFFHTLGMVDDEVSGRGWVNRFMPAEHKKVALTQATKELLRNAYSAFGVTLDRFVEELFDGEDAVRGVLVNYVTLQLLSDAAFCLDRWKVKGGGRPRSQNHNKHIAHWLWRALWDIYVASDLNTSKQMRALGIKTENCVVPVTTSPSSPELLQRAKSHVQKRRHSLELGTKEKSRLVPKQCQKENNLELKEQPKPNHKTEVLNERPG